MGLSDFTAKLTVRDDFSKAFKDFDKHIGGAGKGVDKIGGLLSGGGGLGAIGGLLGGAAGIYGVTQIAEMAMELGNLGAQAITTRDSFENMMASAGLSVSVLNEMKRAAGGTIPELQLMQQANTALAGVTGELSGELAAAFPKLIEIARAANKANPALGDTSYLFNSLVLGIKRGSPMILDNLGLQIKLGAANEAYAKALGKTVDEMTAQEKTQALLNDTMRAGGDLIQQVGGDLDTLATSADELKTAWADLKTEMGEALAPSTSQMQREIADALIIVNKSVFGDDIARQEAKIIQTKNAIAQAQGEINKAYNLGLEPLSYWVEALASEKKLLADQSAELETIKYNQELANTYGMMHASVVNAASGIDTMTAAMERQVMSIEDANKQVDGWLGRMRSVAGMVDPRAAELAKGVDVVAPMVGALGGAVSREEASALYNDMYGEWLDLQNDIRGESEVIKDWSTRRWREEWDDKLGIYRTAYDGMKSYAKDTYSKINSMVAGMLTPTFDLGGLTGGVLGNEGGDTWDEDYKRLAAIALRPEEEIAKHSVDWAGLIEQAGLSGKSPEEQAAIASQILSEFDKGQNYDFVRWDVVDKQVGDALAAEKARAGLEAEIAARYGAGSDMAGAVLDGTDAAFKNTDIAASTVDYWTTDFNKNEVAFSAIGSSAGRWMLDGVKDAVKEDIKEVVTIIAKAVAPEVADILGNRAGGALP